MLVDQAVDRVIKSRHGHAKMIGKVLLPYQLHGLDGFGPERRVRFVSGGSIVKLEKVGSTEGLAVKKLEGRLLPGAIDQSGARVGSAAEGRIVVVAESQIQNEVFSEVNFVLSVNGKYI